MKADFFKVLNRAVTVEQASRRIEEKRREDAALQDAGDVREVLMRDMFGCDLNADGALGGLAGQARALPF
jgi:hypothetical protein